MQENGNNGASWMDKIKGLGGKVGNDLKDRASEAATVTRLNQATGFVGDVATQVGHGVGEEVTRFVGAVDVVGDRLGQAGEYVGKTADNLASSAKKDLSGEVVGAGLKKFGYDVVGKIQNGVQEVVMRNAGKLATIYNDHAAPVLRRNGIDLTAKAYNAYDAFDKRSEAVDPADKAEVKAAEKIEGQQMIDDVMGNLKAAVDFDQMKDQAVSALIEKALGGTELARKAGPALLKGLVAMMLEGSNFSGRTADAKKGLQALLSDKEQMAELKSKQIDISQLVEDFNAALEDISSKRELVMASRGKENISWEYEGDLIKASESFQSDAIDLGYEVIAALPEKATELNIDNIVAARVKAIDLASKTRDVVSPLKSVAKNMERRFPEKADEIKASLSRVLAKWTEAKGVARQLMTEVKVDKATSSKVEGDMLAGIIDKNDMFNSITAKQQRAVMDQIGAKVKGESEPAQYDRVPGSLYDRAISAGEEYTRLVVCYEQSREYVTSHPEAADILMILAENVMQAKSRMELAQNKIDAEVLVQSHKLKNKSEFTAERQGNLAKEDADRISRKEGYALILSRFNDRVQKEGPTVKKIAMLLGVAGFSVVIGKEAGPEIIDATIATAKFIAKVIMDNSPMIIDAVKTVGKATAVGGALAAPVLLWNWAMEKLGKQAEKDAYKGIEQADNDKVKALSELQASYNRYDELGDKETAADIKRIMDRLKGGNS